MSELCRERFSMEKSEIKYYENGEDQLINKKFPVNRGTAIPYPTNYIKKFNKKAYRELTEFFENSFTGILENLTYLGTAISNKKKGNIVSYYNDLVNNKFYEILYDKEGESFLIKMVVVFDGVYEN